ncbi:unnamed protein product [Linum tenue]|uniref:Major facilitator superfamily (MFS) profile domain-containing protein n=1 Tax=Linum tenue TaxID=586396 RepID=A0AAV0KY93_9ROSI|nr:unnamed protein product [Linum tenue]
MASKEGRNMRDPLIQKSSRKNESLWMVYLSTFVAVCGSYVFGCGVGFSSPTQDAIREDLSLSLAEAMRLSSAICAAGWLAIYLAKGAEALDIGRLATGFGMGVFSYVVPVFISEIAPKNLRGALATLNQVMICGGASVSFIIGTFLTWRALALTGLVPCAILLFGLHLIPESPRWLAKTGHEKDFEVALQKLRGNDADISEEAAEIKEYIETLDRLPKVKFLDLFQRRYLRSVIIGVGLMVVQQFGGINGVAFYASNIFKSAGVSPSVGTITYAILQVVVTLLITQVIDRAGRKPLLLVKIKPQNIVTWPLLTSRQSQLIFFFFLIFFRAGCWVWFGASLHDHRPFILPQGLHQNRVHKLVSLSISMECHVSYSRFCFCLLCEIGQ